MTGPGVRTRVLILAALLAAAFGGLAGRVAWLAVVEGDELRRFAERQYSRTVVLHAQRGPIVDRLGAPLATSTMTESLFAQPRSLGDPGRVAARLAPLVGVPEDQLHGALTSGRSFVWLRRKLPPAVAERVRALGEPGLGFVPEPLRLYPNRELAAHVLGFQGVEGGLEGIERGFDEVLAGLPGKAIVDRDALGRQVATPHVLRAPVAGQGVMLTLDRTIQYVAERELDAAWRRTGARSALAMVMEPRTGEVLALAGRPTFNPNAFLDVPAPDTWRARAVTDPFEPGSTFKAILAAAALEEGVVRPDDRIWAEGGQIRVAGVTIHDWKQYGWLSFAQVLQQSSNVGAIKVGLALGRERYYRYITAFGFGAPTGIELAGESRGLLRPLARWSALTLPSLSIGQEISVTAVQLVAAFGAIANGGVLVQPRLVRALFDDEGREVRRFEPRAVRRVISPETAATLTRLLVGVVAEGTGRRAAIAGHTVAGKTGTAQKLDPTTRRYSRAPGVLSFVGFAPAEAPRFVALVLLDEPRTERWGSEAAAPVFAAIGQELLQYLEVPPRDREPVHLVAGAPAEGQGRARARPAALLPGVMPDLAGLTLRPALATLAALGARVEISGRGVVGGQTPAPGARLAAGDLARLVLVPSPERLAAAGMGR